MSATTVDDWKAIAARAKAIWKNHIGGDATALAERLHNAAGLTVHGPTLTHTMNGRKPKAVADHIDALAKMFASRLGHIRPDLSQSELEAKAKAHIYIGAPSPFEQPVEPPAKAIRKKTSDAALWGFDLWTPGQSADVIIGKFGRHLGSRDAQRLADLSHKAIAAIAQGDFQQQSEIADRTIEIGETIPQTPARGEGLYLKGEALRLLADFEPDRAKARALRQEAESFYGQAEDALGGDPRPMRGRARTIEVLGELDRAWEVFQQSFAVTQARITDPNESDHLSITHERVRTLRHKINCLAAMHAEMPLATSEAQRRGREIHNLILESEPQHRDALKVFEPYGDWWRIEWFMAEVLHAKGWAAIGENSRAAKRLEWSLRQRLDMMVGEGPLSPIELGNLHWWAGVASPIKSAFEVDQQRTLSELLDVIGKKGASRQEVKDIGRDFLRIGDAPWTKA